MKTFAFALALMAALLSLGHASQPSCSTECSNSQTRFLNECRKELSEKDEAGIVDYRSESDCKGEKVRECLADCATKFSSDLPSKKDGVCSEMESNCPKSTWED